MVEVTQADIDFAHELAFMGFATIHDYEMHVRKMAAAHREAGHRAGMEEAARIALAWPNFIEGAGIAATIRAKIGDEE